VFPNHICFICFANNLFVAVVFVIFIMFPAHFGQIPKEYLFNYEQEEEAAAAVANIIQSDIFGLLDDKYSTERVAQGTALNEGAFC
jgi:hypothetical protein